MHLNTSTIKGEYLDDNSLSIRSGAKVHVFLSADGDDHPYDATRGPGAEGAVAEGPAASDIHSQLAKLD